MPHQRITALLSCAACGTQFERSIWHLTQAPKCCSRGCILRARALSRPSAAERFWRYVDKNGPIPEHRPELGACWLWTASRDSFGYGRFSFNKRMRQAHAVAYILMAGREPPPKTPYITHLCDGGNIGCVRPSHLKPDTKAGNQAGMAERGRAASKLTRSQVLEIRARYDRGRIGYQTLAREYGVSFGAIWFIVNRWTWKHVE